MFMEWVKAQPPSFWLMLTFYIVAAVWAVAAVLPFMKVTKRAAVEGLAQSVRTINLLAALEADAAQLIAEARAAIAEAKDATAGLDRDRIARALAALEALPAKVDALAKASPRAALGPVRMPEAFAGTPPGREGFAGRVEDGQPR